MAMEVVCGSCEGHLLIETPGVVVACPHCGVHLSIPATEAADALPVDEAPAEEPPAAEPSLEPEPPEVGSSEPRPPREEMPRIEAELSVETATVAVPVASASPPEPDATLPPGDSFPNFAWTPDATRMEEREPQATFITDSAAATDPLQFPAPLADDQNLEPVTTDEAQSQQSDLLAHAGPAFDVAAPKIVPWQPVHPSSAAETPVVDTPAAPVLATSAAPSQMPHAPKPTTATARESTPSTARPMVSRTAFVAVLSYASAATIALIYVLLAWLNSRAHQLESLPDLRPELHDGKAALILAPEDAPMPPGHTLALGETRRFGSVEVTPLRVTRGTIEFEHFSGRPDYRRAPSGPVLKLWLRFRNVSQDQRFAPLDRLLLLTRTFDQFGGDPRANNFVAPVDQKRRDGHRVFVYDLPVDGEYALVGQDAGKEIGPGEELVTFIPTTEEGLSALQGPLVWRVQFRKGYNPDSLRGVTTLIEVTFDSDEIQSEPPAA